MLSVALSLILRPVGITDHPALRSPDFPLANKFASDHLTSECQFNSVKCELFKKPNPISGFHYSETRSRRPLQRGAISRSFRCCRALPQFGLRQATRSLAEDLDLGDLVRTSLAF